MSAELIGITGADGWVGRHVSAWLIGQGYAVRLLSRSGRLPDSIALDLTSSVGPAWRHAVEGCSAVVHCAAHVHRPNESAAEQEVFRLINTIGTEHLIASCMAVGVKRFVLASSIAVYDWTNPGDARSERSPVRPVTSYGRSKLDAERVVRASRCDWRIARMATVYGTGDRANFGRLASALKRGRFVLPGDGGARKSVLPVEVAGELLGRLATSAAISNCIVNLAAPVAPSLAQICAAFCNTCGFRAPRRLPVAALRALAALGDTLASLGLRVPLTTETLGKLITNTVVDVGLMQSLIPKITWPRFDQSLARSAEYYGAL